jgi:hypothetical protein
MITLEGYDKEELTIDAVKANLYAVLVTIPVGVLLGLPYYLLWKENFNSENLKSFVASNKSWMTYSAPIVIVVMLLGVILHELIHGITWARFTKEGFKSIKFGVLWKVMTPYCHCNEPLLLKHYIIGGAMPAIILGIVPALVGMVTGHLAAFTLGLFFTIAAAGDFMIINMLRKEDRHDFVQDHPSKIGCYIYRRASIAPEAVKE